MHLNKMLPIEDTHELTPLCLAPRLHKKIISLLKWLKLDKISNVSSVVFANDHYIFTANNDLQYPKTAGLLGYKSTLT